MNDKTTGTIAANPCDEPDPPFERHQGYSNQGAQLDLTVTYEMLKRVRRRDWPLSIHRPSKTARR